MLAFAVAATGCDSGGGDGGSGGGGVGGDGGDGGVGGGGMGGDGGMGGSVAPGAVTADPEGAAFDPPTIEVTLSTDEGTPIYYTTDLTPVLDEEGNVQGTEYTGPITMGTTTVLKFLTGADDEYTAEQSEGYTLINNPIRAEWAMSGHGDITAEAWRHWDEDGEVPNRCARCHGNEATQPPPTPPFRGILEFAQTGENLLNAPLALGLDCVNCHETFPSIYADLAMYGGLEPIGFPSTAELSLYGPSNICMSCHQGRESGEDVKARIDADDGMGPYRFLNVHYYPAAAILFGGAAKGGFEYLGNSYRARNSFPSHPEPAKSGVPGDDFSTCVGCHMRLSGGVGIQHTWEPNLTYCQDCHTGDSFATLSGTPSQSYDAITELVPELYAEIQRYAAEEITGPEGEDGWPITYENHYPYFFDMNGGSYTQFDSNLLAAAYNYQVGLKDPAAFIHSGTYLQQILYDSIVDLGGSTTVAVLGRGELAIEGADIGLASKTQQWQLSAHGALETEPFRHWDEDYEPDGFTPAGISSSCTRCHSSAGFTQLAMGDATTSHYPTTGVDCWACHNQTDLFADPATRYSDLVTNPALEDIVFPSGDTASFDNNSNMCMACHQGRSSTVQVDDATPNGTEQSPVDYDSYNFINIHYYAAAATLFGTDVRGGYEYVLNTYSAQNAFPGIHAAEGRNLVDCVGCHMDGSLARSPAAPLQTEKHTFMPAIEDCTFCHSDTGGGFQDLSGAPGRNFRDVEQLKGDLLEAIEDYADVGGGLPNVSRVFYEGHTYPYWFKCDSDETCDNKVGASYGNRYTDFDFDMLTAAYNYGVSDKEPGGYIHNAAYIEQLLYDSTLLMGGTPTVTPPLRP
jgi:hypothetical protein